MDFVAIDMEKLDDSPLSVCEIGMVKFKNGKYAGDYHSYIRPTEGLSRNFFGRDNLKRITDEMLSKARTFSEIYNEIKAFVDGALLVCHYKGADLNYLYYNEKAHGLSGLYTEYIDTMDICNQSLEDAYQTIFGKQMENHHYAFDDAKHTAEILLALKDVEQFIKKDYLPEKEKPKSDNKKFLTVSSEGLVKEDSLLTNYDFKDKICVLSGGSGYLRDSLKSKLEERGAKVTGTISRKTNAFIVGEDVGWSKKEQAELQKRERPDSFHIFTQEGVDKKIGRG
jgi:DNA polymerase III alpha subunit (gram-positive type)